MFGAPLPGQLPDPVTPFGALQTAAQKRARLKEHNEFLGYMNAHPGAAPGGTGDTGLDPSDAAGWSKLLQDQQTYLTDDAQIQGKAGPAIRFNGYGPGAANLDPGGGVNRQRAGATGGGSAGVGATGFSNPFDQDEAERLAMRRLRAQTYGEEADVPDPNVQYHNRLADEAVADMRPRAEQLRIDAMDPYEQRANKSAIAALEDQLASQYSVPAARYKGEAEEEAARHTAQAKDTLYGSRFLPNQWAGHELDESEAQASEDEKAQHALDLAGAKGDDAEALQALKNLSASDVAAIKAGATSGSDAMSALARIVSSSAAKGRDPQGYIDAFNANRPPQGPAAAPAQPGTPAQGATRTVNGQLYTWNGTRWVPAR